MLIAAWITRDKRRWDRMYFFFSVIFYFLLQQLTIIISLERFEEISYTIVFSLVGPDEKCRVNNTNSLLVSRHRRQRKPALHSVFCRHDYFF